MKIKLVGGSYQQRYLSFDAQRSINLFPVIDQDGKEISALYGTPGLSLFSTPSSTAIRGCFSAANGRAFAVADTSLYEINSDGSYTKRGSLSTSSGICYIDENGLQLAICDGTYLYILTYSSNAFVQVISSLPTSVGNVTFIDGYFVVNKNNSGSFYISNVYDGTIWNSLDFATAESSPDNLLRVLNGIGQLWLFGDKTTEVWYNSGASNFPFSRLSGAKIDVGIYAPATAIAVDSSIFWVGKTAAGGAIVYRANGFSPQRISTNPIELIIQSAPTPSTLRAWTYQEEGHTFYVITGGGMQTSLVYDISTQLWHERAYLNGVGSYEQHLGSCSMYAFGYQLVGSRKDGKLYKMSLSYYDDDGMPISAERIYTHLSEENKRIRLNNLEIFIESGVGSEGGSDPQISLFISKDGAKTWSNEYFASMGKIGEYRKRVIFRKIGVYYMVTFRLKITDTCRRAIIGSYLT